MSSGLFTGYNLSEVGLNATDAVQKLYGPQVHQDLLMFAFASRLESVVNSSSLSSSNQIYGLVNEPISDSQGNVFLRTKFMTLGKPDPTGSLQEIYTFSDNNLVWLDAFSPDLDKRTSGETEGAPVKVSVNGSIVSASVEGVGSNYYVEYQDGIKVTLPAQVKARLLGKTSGANSAEVSVTIKENGTVDVLEGVTILNGGFGYASGEYLELIPGCNESDTPSEDRCLNYNYPAVLKQSYFVNGQVSKKALIKNELYMYRVSFSDRDGFFLYDDLEQKYVFLGSEYDSVLEIEPLESPSISIKRKDQLSSQDFVKLYNLNGVSAFYSYGDSFRVVETISDRIKSLSDKTEELRSSFKLFIQNSVQQKTISDSSNTLGTQFNILGGKNVISDHRIVLRDPDGVLDQESLDFTSLSTLTLPGQTSLSGQNIPGIWLWTGEKYGRVFSSDEKAFMSVDGKKYLSPAVYDESGSELSETGSYKYSVSSSYLKPGTSVVRGFDTQLTTLIQNLSGPLAPENGGFVYHRTLSPDTLRTEPTYTVKAWPLFSYREDDIVKDVKLLAI